MKYRQLLGQHFLKDREVAQKIVEAAEILPSDFVVEIGPGQGVLTFPLLQGGCQILAIEKDRRLGERLRQVIKNPKFKIIIDNALFRLPYLDLPEDWKLVSNLPFQITSPILNLLLKGDEKGKPTPPSLAVLMVQKEVAERLTAPPGDGRRGLLTVLVESSAKIEELFEVSKDSFRPSPKVDSAVIRLINFKRSKNSNKLEIFLKAGFAHKRALLKNSLAFSLKVPPQAFQEALAQAHIPPSSRAEDLTLIQWQELTKQLAKKF